MGDLIRLSDRRPKPASKPEKRSCDLTIGERIERVKASINRIQTLMQDLREMEEKGGCE